VYCSLIKIFLRLDDHRGARPRWQIRYGRPVRASRTECPPAGADASAALFDFLHALQDLARLCAVDLMEHLESAGISCQSPLYTPISLLPSHHLLPLNQLWARTSMLKPEKEVKPGKEGWTNCKILCPEPGNGFVLQNHYRGPRQRHAMRQI
jgi:hypothetical protein